MPNILYQLSDCSITIDEMKVLAGRMKVLKPVQKIICSFLGIKKMGGCTRKTWKGGQSAAFGMVSGKFSLHRLFLRI